MMDHSSLRFRLFLLLSLFYWGFYDSLVMADALATTMKTKTPQNARKALPHKLLIGYSTDCRPEVMQAIRQGGVNVVIWSFIDIRRSTTNQDNDADADAEIQLHTNSLNISEIAALKASLEDEFPHVLHLTALGGWNGPHVDTTISAHEWWTFWKDHFGHVFDGLDWDPEGHDDRSQSTNTLSIEGLNLVGEISQLAKADGYIVSLAPAQSYLDLDASHFSRSLILPRYPHDGNDTEHHHDWHPEFRYFGANGYAYLLARFGHAPWDFVSIQFYESYSRAAMAINGEQQSPYDYLISYTKRHVARGEAWIVNFEDDPSVQLANQAVSLPLSKLVWGFANGWALDTGDKVVYMEPSEVQAAYDKMKHQPMPTTSMQLSSCPSDSHDAKDDNDEGNDHTKIIDMTPRGFMFWVIGEEGKHGISLAPALHKILLSSETVTTNCNNVVSDATIENDDGDDIKQTSR